MFIANTICYITGAIFNYNITGNVSIYLVHEILLFTDRFQQTVKFQRVLQDIEDGTICILQSPNMESFSISPIAYKQQKHMVHPWYPPKHQYEGASQSIQYYLGIVTIEK